MAEEKPQLDQTNSDDVNMLRVLLHEVRGLSPVSTTDFLEVSLDGDFDAV